MPLHPYRPTPEEIRLAYDRPVPDVIASGLRVLFCGINPGLFSGAVGHHFARPGNRFWPTLYRAGFTTRQLSPFEEQELIDYGCGITNVVNRATAAAAELAPQELVEGGRKLIDKVQRVRPRFLAVLGIGAFRSAFGRPEAVLGLQEERIGETAVWVLPNPSGLNAHYTLSDLAALYAELRQAASK